MRMIIDRIEGPLAVLEYRGKTYNLPKEFLPEDAREGDVVSLEIKVDKDDTGRRRKEINKLMDELF